jgi:type II secretory pathway component GspD/PulD (secretin)
MMRRVLIASCVLAWFVLGLWVTRASAGEPIAIDARDTDLLDVIRLLALQSGTNIVAGESVRDRKITFRLHDVGVDTALATLAAAYDLELHRSGATIVLSARPENAGATGAIPAPARQTAVFALERARSEDVAAILSASLPPGSVAVADKRNSAVVVTAIPDALRSARQLVTTLDAPVAATAAGVDTTAIPVRNARASDVLKALKAAQPDTPAIADDRTNSIIVAARRDVLDATRALIERIDRPGRQVLFEVKVTDVKPIDDSSNVGLQFGGAGFGSGALAQFPYTLTTSSVTVNAQLDALVQVGRAQILATPRITTLNNREASLLVGETYPVVTVNQQSGFPTVTDVDIGVQLRVTPTIGEDGVITAEMHPSYSAINGFNGSFPIVANRKVDSTVRVRDGETIVLGGLFEETSSETIARLPFLSDIPILGRFFQNKATAHERDEVVFLITPHIVTDDQRSPDR